MEKVPKKMTICNLEVLLMPNGEIICLGNTLGWFREYRNLLHVSPEEQE